MTSGPANLPTTKYLTFPSGIPPIVAPRPIALLFAPFRNRTSEIAEQTDKAIRHLLALGWAPVFLPYMLRAFLDDAETFQRATALECSRGLVSTLAPIHSAWAFTLGISSEGVDLDVAVWLQYGGNPVRQVTFTAADAPH